MSESAFAYGGNERRSPWDTRGAQPARAILAQHNYHG
jgi:hypothetical protein